MLFVASLIIPIMKGAAKPERLPKELMNAMPAAAAAPPRKAVGMPQKTGSVDMMPMVAMVSPTSDQAVLPCMATLITKPPAPTTAATAECQRCSRWRSALRAVRYMAITPKDQGIALSSPMSSAPFTPIALMMLGSQNEMP